MPISDVAQVTVLTTGSPVSRPGFGTPLIADPCLAWGASQDRVRSYANLAAMIADGFVASDGAYKAAAAIFAQPNPPPKIKLGRRALKPTQHWTLTPVAVNLTTYRVTVDGVDSDYVSDGTATVAEITAGLKTSIDAKAIPGISTVDNGTNLVVQATVAGAWHSVKTMRIDTPTYPNPNIACLQDQADPGIATDLAALLAADADWYGLCLTHTSKAEILAAAAWVEANGPRMFVQATQDSDARTTAPGGADVMASAKASNYARTAVFYHPDNASFLGAALQGARLSTDPGSSIWGEVALAGVTAVGLTSTEQGNLDGKNGNYYYEVAPGTPMTRPGKVADNEWIDAVIFRDWIQVNMALDCVALQVRVSALGKKIPMDDTGIAAFQSVALSRLKNGVDVGGLLASPAPSCQVPLASAISATDRGTRTLNGVTWTAYMANAIQLTKISGFLQ